MANLRPAVGTARLFTQVMQILPVLALAAIVLAIGAPIVHAWRANHALGRFRTLEPDEQPEHPPARVSVIVPARNEAQDLRASVESLLRQRTAGEAGGVQLEVIVVDDHSTDATGEIADELAARDDRVRVVHDPPLREGWLGKANAMESALELATGDYILVTDADILHDGRALGTALADMHDRETDFLSLYPRYRLVSVWENALVPLINTGLGEFATYPAMAAGAFMLTRADVLRREGGFEPIRVAPLDDVGLACHLHERGAATDFCLGPELVSVRAFKGNHDAFWGTTKTVLVHFEGRMWLLPAAVALTFAMYWTPPLAVAAGIAMKLPAMVAVGVAAYLLQLGSLFVSRRVIETRMPKVLCFPIIPLAVAACVARALHGQRSGSAILWRGRRSKIPRSSGVAGARGLRREG